MSKRKNLKAYVRLDKNRKPVPGSLIYRKDKPYGEFAPMLDPYGDICCSPSPSGCQAGADLLYEYQSASTSNGGEMAAADADCNTYLLYWQTAFPTGAYFSEHAIVKKDKDGNTVWNKVINVENPVGFIYNVADSNNSWAAGFDIDRLNGRIYVWIASGVLIALDLDGNVLYCKSIKQSLLVSLGVSNNYAPSKIAIAPDGSFVYLTLSTDTNVIGLGYQTVSYLIKVDALTGNIVKEIEFPFYQDTAVPIGDAYGVSCDENGDLYVNVGRFSLIFSRSFLILKFDSDLNELWRTNTYFDRSIDPISVANGSLVCTLIGYPNNNIAKFDSTTGALVWCKSFSTNYTFSDARIDQADNVCIYGAVSGTLYVAKLTPDGTTIEFFYSINSTDFKNLYWGYSGLVGPNPIGIKWLLSFYGNGSGGQLSTLISVGLEDMSGKSAGGYTFTAVPETISNVSLIVAPPAVFTPTVSTIITNNWGTLTGTTADAGLTFVTSIIP